MRNVLVGAVESTLVALEAMAASGVSPSLLVTLPRTKAARHSDFVDLTPSARDLNVPVLYATKVNDPDVVDAIRNTDPDFLFVIGWSQICGADLLMLPARGAIGYHPAPLPEFRGRAVIPWTILQGCRRTGSTLFWMDDGMDSGDILSQECFDVSPEETAATLVGKHMTALRGMFSVALPRLAQGEEPRRPQEHARATYCARRTAADGLIDWRAPAEQVWTLIRAVGDPYPGAFTFIGSERVTIWDAELVGPGPYIGLPGQVQDVGEAGALVQCGDGNHIRIRTVQGEGEARCPAGAMLRRHVCLGPEWTRLTGWPGSRG